MQAPSSLYSLTAVNDTVLLMIGIDTFHSRFMQLEMPIQLLPYGTMESRWSELSYSV